MTIDLWVEKYRPATLDDYVWRDAAMRAKVEDMLRQKVLPHLLLSGPPGCGKTSLAGLLMRELAVPPNDVMWVNASRERGIDELQTRISNFVQTWALGPSGIKYVILDECLDGRQEILLGDGSVMALNDLPDFEPFTVKSFNMATGLIEDDVGLVISRKEEEVFEVVLQDGRTVTATANHPFLVRDSSGQIMEKRLQDLLVDDDIVVVDVEAQR